jgi:chemotaxis protein methyltransferase CheR
MRTSRRDTDTATATRIALEQELLRELAIDRFGIDLSARARGGVIGRLRTRLDARQVRTLGEYYRILKHAPQGVEEWGHFADAITNEETYLFRGRGQFDDLVDLLPELVKARGDRPLRFLSAGCSSGQEAYSLCAVLADHAHLLGAGFEVVGVDISTPRLAQACVGRYAARDLRPDLGLPRGVRIDAHFERDGDNLSVRPQLRRRVTFQIGNLAAPGGLGLGRFDVVFCRNVLIYAHDEGWPRFVKTLAASLARDGYLFLGESEALVGRDAPFTPKRLRSHYAYVLEPCRSA